MLRYSSPFLTPFSHDGSFFPEISQIFDEISYGKGGSILSMIEAFAEPDNFINGVREYLKGHSFGNAIGQNLWDCRMKRL